MKKTKFTTEMLVFTGFMIALAVVLSKLISINISFLRIGFGFLPIAVLAILYGPYVAAIGYGVADLLGAWLFPTGTFFPGFTVSAVLTGLIFGWVLYGKEVTFVRALFACLRRETFVILQAFLPERAPFFFPALKSAPESAMMERSTAQIRTEVLTCARTTSSP